MSPCFPQKKKVLADLQRGLYGADERTRTFTPEHKNLNLACLPIPPRPRIATRGTAGEACGGFLIATIFLIKKGILRFPF